MKRKLVYIIGSSLVAGSLIFGGTAIANESGRPAMFGQVVAKDGNRITVSGKSGKGGATTTYTIDTSDATITEGLGLGSTELGASNVSVGDQVAVLATNTD